MKKILGILILAVLLIFSAGCITEEDDEILGTWKMTEGSSAYELTYQFEDDNTGTTIYETADGAQYVRLMEWKKYDEGYEVRESAYLTFHEDGTMSDPNGLLYTLEEGGEKIGGVWTMVDKNYWDTNEPLFDAYTDSSFVFSEDGRATHTYTSGGETESDSYVLVQFGEYLTIQGPVYSYSVDEKGNLLIEDDVYEPTDDNSWKRVDESTGSTVEVTFYSDGMVSEATYDSDGNFEYVYFYEEINAEGAGLSVVEGIDGFKKVPDGVVAGELFYTQLSQYSITDDGKLVDTIYDEEVFEKI